MEERRRIDRVGYQAKSVIVVCDSGESIFVETCNVSPLGIAFTMPAGSPDLKGKDIIIVADNHVCGCHQAGSTGRRKLQSSYFGKEVHAGGAAVFI